MSCRRLAALTLALVASVAANGSAQNAALTDAPRKQIKMGFAEYPIEALENGIAGIVNVAITVSLRPATSRPPPSSTAPMSFTHRHSKLRWACDFPPTVRQRLRPLLSSTSRSIRRLSRWWQCSGAGQDSRRASCVPG
jgi:hypothetical protein